MGPGTVVWLLREQGFSLQGNPNDRGRPAPRSGCPVFLLNDQARQHLDAGDPVISVDTKKKELVGRDKKRRAGVAAGR
jgi:hypothetical protein